MLKFQGVAHKTAQFLQEEQLKDRALWKKFVEAFSLGTPVIGSDLGNTGSLIQEGVNGWKFRHDSPEALAEKIRVCSETPYEQLRIVCDESILPEGNYKELIKIYNCIEEHK